MLGSAAAGNFRLGSSYQFKINPKIKINPGDRLPESNQSLGILQTGRRRLAKQKHPLKTNARRTIVRRANER
jgi:hypothetical protein